MLDFRKETLLLTTAVLPAAALLYVRPELPPEIPVHFDFSGTPDRYGPPWELAWVAPAVYLLTLLPLFVDPRRSNLRRSERMFFRIRLVIIGFLSLLNTGLLLDAANLIAFNPMAWAPAGAMLLLAALGNYMVNLKPNYSMGVRTPWTLESEQVWRSTHRFTGRLWFGMGLIGAIASLVVAGEHSALWLGLWLGIMLLAPVVYSYARYRQLEA